MDRLPNKGSAQADNAQLVGWPKYLNNMPEGQSNHRPKGLSEEERCPFSNFSPPSDQSARFGLQPTSGWPLRPEGLAKALLPTLTPRLRSEVHRSSAHRSSPTDATRADYGRPTRDACPERTRERTEKARQGAQVKPRYQGPYPIRL